MIQTLVSAQETESFVRPYFRFVPVSVHQTFPVTTPSIPSEITDARSFCDDLFVVDLNLETEIPAVASFPSAEVDAIETFTCL